MNANYELTLILGSKITSAKKKSFLESLEKTVKILEGKVEKVEDWGVRDLFHEIKKNKEGLYLHALVNIQENAVKQLDMKLKVNEEVLRYLIIKA